jgi:hypothetical protein
MEQRIDPRIHYLGMVPVQDLKNIHLYLRFIDPCSRFSSAASFASWDSEKNFPCFWPDLWPADHFSMILNTGVENFFQSPTIKGQKQPLFCWHDACYYIIGINDYTDNAQYPARYGIQQERRIRNDRKRFY